MRRPHSDHLVLCYLFVLCHFPPFLSFVATPWNTIFLRSQLNRLLNEFYISSPSCPSCSTGTQPGCICGDMHSSASYNLNWQPGPLFLPCFQTLCLQS